MAPHKASLSPAEWILAIIPTLGILVGPARALDMEELHGWSTASNIGQLCIHPVSHLVKAFWNEVKVFRECMVETQVVLMVPNRNRICLNCFEMK